MSRLWYKQPAVEWEEALPLGNGRLGAMVFGGLQNERIQVNEESMWYGGKVDRRNPDAAAALPLIREYLEQGRIGKAEDLMQIALAGCPNGQHPYQTLGDISFSFAEMGEVTEYSRSLDLDNATCVSSWRAADTLYQRECFISKPADCMVMRFTAQGSGRISFTARLERCRYFDGVGKWQQDGIMLYGNLGRGGFEYTMMLRGKVRGGILKLVGECIQVEDAEEVLLYFGADTTYHYSVQEQEAYMDKYSPRLELPDKVFYEGLTRMEREEYRYQMVMQQLLREKIAGCLDSAMEQEYADLRAEHIADYQYLYKRTELRLEGGDSLEALPTDERLRRLQETETKEDIGLGSQLFDFGRYLLISCSREGGLPATLQGIWNKDFLPPWDSKYTININTEMNYWPAECCNLSECHIPLFDLLEKVQRNGRATARSMYGCRGFVAHHNVDIHGDTAPQDLWIPGTYWVMGATWLCTHLWTHYRYTQDREFLKRAFPILAEAALFFVDFLIEKDGYLVTSPSVSPENTYILPSGERGSCCIGATMDNQILRDLFGACTEAYRILGKEEAEKYNIPDADNMETLIEQIQKVKEKLMPTRIGSQGRIMEWMEEYDEAEPGHRHISHLYGLYPSEQITVDGTPELAAAARKTLEHRLANGGGHTGWSRAWIMNHYAKLWDGEKAYENICKMLTSSTYPNLFDKHPPFQIDGNFGAAAAIAQMLVQSNEDRVRLLPALPKAWESGSVKGLRLVGNAEIDIEWKAGKLCQCRLQADSDWQTEIRYGEQSVQIKLAAGEGCILDKEFSIKMI